MRWLHDPAHHRSNPAARYRLFLRFNNGESGEVDLSDEIVGEVLDALRDPAVFATARQHPVMRTAAWAKGADLAPEFLLDLMRAQQGDRGA